MTARRRRRTTAGPGPLGPAVGYIRVSTAGQAENGGSLDDQRERIQAYATAHELQLERIISDQASGRNLDRPGMRHLLKLVRARKIGAVIIVKLDRLTRSLRDLGELIELVEAKGVALRSIGDSIDTSTASGRLVLNVLGSVVQWQREAIAERTAEVLASKRAQGFRISCNAPYGYQLDGKRWVPEPHEHEGLCMIHELRELGETYRDIGTILYRRGFPARNGKPLSPAVIMRALRQPPPGDQAG